jgi:Flp pilus assembly protein TadD
MDVFVGRSAEQERFRAVLRQVTAERTPGPDEGFLVLVHGHGGLGKTHLLGRYREIASGESADDRGNRDRFVVAVVDWEQEQRLRRADFAGLGGPPIWKVLDRLYRAVADGASMSPRRRRLVAREFDPFRQRMTQLPELMERARQLGLDTVVGRQRWTAEELGALVDAAASVGVAGLVPGMGAVGAPKPSGVPGGPLGRLAATATTKASAYWRGRVDADAYTSLIAEVDGLVRAFTHGLRSLSRKGRPVVLILDTCELLQDTADWLLELIRQSGMRTAWAVGVRLAPQADTASESAMARFHTAPHHQRMVSVPLETFDEQAIADYLHSALGDRLPGVRINEVARVTRGIPLAVFLLATLLRRGRDPEEVLRSSLPEGSVSQLVRGLVQRYLTHIRSSPGLAADLPLVHGLALLAQEWIDPQLLAALWDIPATEVSGQLDRLARRHDFLRGATRQLHQDVRDAVLQHLLDPVERETVRPLNERAVAHLLSRLAEEGPLSLEGQLADESWQRHISGLLWHTYWLDPREGHRLLCHLFPAAAVLDAALAVDLTQIAYYFVPLYSTTDRHALNGLCYLAARPYLPHLREEASADSLGGAGGPNLSAVMAELEETSTAEPILGAGIPRRLFLDVLAAMHGDLFGVELDQRLTRLEHAAEQVTDDTTATRQAIATLARRLAGRITMLNLGLGSEDPGGVEVSLALRAARLAVALNPGSAFAHTNLGSTLAQLERWEEAEPAFREANRLDPATTTRNATWGHVLQALGRYDESVAVLRDAARDHPHMAFVHTELGMSLLAAGQPKEAVVELRKAVRIDPDDGRAHATLGYALAQTGRFGAAETSLRRALAWDRSADTLGALGVVLAHSGRPDEAEAACREAIGVDPNSAHAHVQLGALLGTTGRHGEAEAAFREAIRLNPTFSEAHYNLGTALTAQGRHGEAKAAFREADRLDATVQDATAAGLRFSLELPAGTPAAPAATDRPPSPDDRRAHLERLKRLMAEGHLDGAADELYELIRIDPECPGAHALLGDILTNLARYAEAEDVLREAIELDPADAYAHAHLGAALFRLWRFDDATATMRHATRLAPDDPAVLGMAGAILGELGHDEEAVEIQRKAISWLPESVHLHVSLAFGLRQLGRFQDAKQALRDALRLNDGDAGAHTNLGELSLFVGDNNAAEDSLQRAIELDPRTTMKAHVLLAVLLRPHDPHAAQGAFRAALVTSNSHQSEFAHAELRAIALAALGDAAAAGQLLEMARRRRIPSDTFRKPIYDLLQRPPLPGVDQLLAVWQQIIAADPTAARPFDRPPDQPPSL